MMKQDGRIFIFLALLMTLGACSDDTPDRQPDASSYGGDAGWLANPKNSFVTVWDTIKPSNFDLTIGDIVSLPLVYQGDYNFRVDWGDGTSDHITQPRQEEATHQYAEPGVYTVTIVRQLEGWPFESSTYLDRDHARFKAGRNQELGCFQSRYT